MIRRQLPAYSPMSLSAWGRALWASATGGDEACRGLVESLKARFGVADAFLTGSGTQSLQLAMELVCGEKSSHRLVALPAFSCYDLVSAAIGADVEVVFYDVDPTTLSPAPDSFARALEAKPRAVVAGNLFGYPLAWDAIREGCRAAGAVLIEDAAQGLGSTYRGTPAGSFGDLTVLSFSRGKGWTGGGGGALLVRDEGYASEKRLALRPGGWGGNLRPALSSLAQFVLGRPSLFGLPNALPWLHLGETHYRAPSPPEGVAPFSAALAGETEPQALSEISLRKANAEVLGRMLKGEEWEAVLTPMAPVSGGGASFLRFPALLKEDGLRDIGFDEPGRWGIVRSYPRALPELEVLAGRVMDSEIRLAGAAALASRLLTFPTHSLLENRDFVAYLRLIKCFVSK